MKHFNWLILLVALAFVGCNDDDTTSDQPVDDLGPLQAAVDNNLSWTWMGSDEMRSRNGTSTGYLVNLNSNSDKLVVYLQGGGACFNPLTCAGNRDAYTNNEGINGANVLNDGFFPLLNRANTSLFISDWNWIFVPYSTGDLHSGTNSDGDVPFNGPQDQRMEGSANMNKIVADLQQYTDSFSEIIVTGSSAGGYGVYLTFPKFAEAYPNASMTGLSDAGPIFTTDSAADNCLGESWESLFQFDYPSDYNTVVTGNYDYAYQGAYEYLSKKYPQHEFGLMSDYKDEVLRFFYGFDANNCDENTVQVSAEELDLATREIQNTLQNFDNWKVFFKDSDAHTFLGDRFSAESINGRVVIDWIEDLTQGNAVDLME
ncbi:MAG: pectinacetylesterase family protein [Saprospiraceae bacterium]|nr:pectinacetylesterase family protein [Saprospiraceae bacterium]